MSSLNEVNNRTGRPSVITEIMAPEEGEDLCDISTIINIPIQKKGNQKGKNNYTMSSSNNVNNNRHRESTESKRMQELEDLCDVSTVVNISVQKKEKTVDKKVERYENIQQDLRGDESISRVQKVTTWLQHLQYDNPEENVNFKDPDWWTTDSELNQIDSSHLYSPRKQLRVFLISIYPNLDEPLDLVSGLCHLGCRGYTVFSHILWLKRDDDIIPVCPRCHQPGNKKELLLMFVVKLRVMDQKGVFCVLNLFKEKAEDFFCCSLQEYVRERTVRENIARFLQDIVVEKTKSFIPFMDVSIVLNKSYYFVTHTRLMLPTLAHNDQDQAPEVNVPC